MNSDDVYDIHRYTDEQLMNILNLANPTDHELEAKILQMIRRYSNIQNESGTKLAHFFNRVYEHFFDTSDDTPNDNLFDHFETIESATDEDTVEGFTASKIYDNRKYTKDTEGTSAELNLKDPKISYIEGPPGAPSTSQLANIVQTQPLDYSNDKTGLNPLIKQTIKRIVNIDSQFRNKAFYPLSTDFTFNLSEPLKDVLSLKLYSIQIPYTWYTINNNYGSNFFYLKGVTKGVDNGLQDYKFIIPTGNYLNTDFSANINGSISSVKAANPDINFGTTNFSFNTLNSKSTFTVDIQNIYNEPYYQVQMDKTVSDYLQFQSQIYPLNTIYSTNTPQPDDPNYKQTTFVVDNSINYFTVIHYTDPSNQYNTATSLIRDVFKVQLLTPVLNLGITTYQPFVGTLKKEDIITYIQNGLQEQTLLDISHSYVTYGVDTKNIYKFTISLQLNKSKIRLYPNSKLCIQFPSRDQYKDASGNFYKYNSPFWCNEYVPFKQELNSWTHRDVSNLNVPPANMSPTMKWKSVAMSDNGIYQSAVVSINTPFDGTISNLYYSFDTGATWRAATVKDTSNNPMPTNYVWDRVVIAGTGNLQFAFSSNNSKLWFSNDYGQTWKDSNLDYGWVCLDFANSNGNVIIVAAMNNPNKVYNLLYDSVNNILTMSEITQISQLAQAMSPPTFIFNVDSPPLNFFYNNISVTQNGTYQIVITSDYIYYTSDTGNTWNVTTLVCNQIPITTLTFVKISYNDTTKIIYTTITTKTQCYILDPSQNNVWLSNNTRAWINSPQTFNYIQSVSVSSDSNVQVICDNTYGGKNGQIYTSQDYGNIWRTTVISPTGINAPNIQWQEVTISKISNGLYQTAVGINDPSGGIWTLYYNNGIYSTTQIYTPIQSFVGFEQKVIDTTQFWLSLDANVLYDIYQYYFYNLNLLYSENNYNYKYDNISITNANNTIQFVSEAGHGNRDKYAAQPISISIPFGTYTLYPGANNLLDQINAQFSATPNLLGSYIKKISSNSNGYEYLEFVFNVNKIYTTNDYKLVFYDVYSFVSCFFGAQGVQNITWDNTLGWILGYRDFTEYYLTAANVQQPTSTSNNGFTYYKGSPTSVYTYTSTIDPISGLEIQSVASLTGDTSVNTTLYNYFYIILDDYNQNHLNDGVVINVQSEANLPLPSYTSTAVESCNNDGTVTYTSGTLTQNQLYSVNSIHQASAPDTTSQASIKQRASYPSVQDVFAFIPVKVNGQTNGTTYIEFGGTLQNQSRLYFGPVNIHRMSVKLVTDKGDTLNLNNANWSFSFECEQLYRNS
jgi:hypothetical protein